MNQSKKGSDNNHFVRYYFSMIFIYLITVLMLVLFSFTQIEHQLLFAGPTWFIWLQNITKEIGHNHRLYAGVIAVVLFSLLFIFQYQLFHYFKHHPKIDISKWLFIIVIICLFAYPASFSHDIFEYSFWARIFVVHHQNPWIIPGSQIMNDSWSTLLHWPNETFKYGPAWFLLSIMAYITGFGNLLLTLYSFKFLILIFSVITCFMIYKISKLLSSNPTLSVAFFLFNPIVILEFFINPHNDIVMACFFMIALYYLLRKEQITSWIYYLLSITTKYTTIILFPVFSRLKNKLSSQELLLVVHFLSLIAALVLIFYRSINAWYFVLLLAVSAPLYENKVIRFSTITLSIGLIARYLPYIFIGYFDPDNKIRLQLFLLAQIPFVVWYIREILKTNMIKKIKVLIFLLRRREYSKLVKSLIKTSYLTS